MNRRVVFPNKLLPYLLLAPQIAITLVFFFWPASQALYQSMLPRGSVRASAADSSGSTISRRVLSDPNYLNSLQVTVVFSLSAAVVALVARCCWR